MKINLITSNTNIPIKKGDGARGSSASAYNGVILNTAEKRKNRARASFAAADHYGSSACTIERERECAQKRDKQNNYDNINTSIKSNPDARVSFKGASVPWLHRLAEYAHNNPLSAEAVCSFFWAGMLRPVSVMAMARDESEKEKCKYQAAKSIASAYIGFFSTVVVGTIVSAGTAAAMKKGIFALPKTIQNNSQKFIDDGVSVLNKLKENIKNSNPELSNQIELFTKPTKQQNKLNLNIFDKKGNNTLYNFKEKIKNLAPEKFETIDKAIDKQKVVDRYEETAKNVGDKLLQPIWMPIRAFMTISLVTPIVKYFGFTKPDNNKEVEQKMFNTLNQSIFQDKNAQEIFQPFYERSDVA